MSTPTQPNPYPPVDSTTRACCGGIGRHASSCTNVETPPDTDLAGSWDGDGYRDIYGRDRTVTDHTLRVYTLASQHIDGTLSDTSIVIADGEHAGPHPLNSDQARELAAVLLEAAAQADQWATR